MQEAIFFDLRGDEELVDEDFNGIEVKLEEYSCIVQEDFVRN